MFLKHVKKLFSNTRSITTQLTFFYTLASFILVGFIAIFLYWAMVNVLYQNDRQFLLDEINVIDYLLKNNDTATLKHEIVNVPVILNQSMYHYSIRILDQNRQAIMETPGMKKALHGSSAIYLNANQSTVQGGVWWHAKHGDIYLLIEKVVPLNNGEGLIEAALDISDQHEIITQYRERALKILALGILFSLVVGYMIARKGLRRLNELTETAKNITTLSLHQRISSHYWPKELRKLGVAFNDMLDRVETSFSQLTQFSDDLAHELRAPVNNLINETEVMLLQPHAVSDYRQVLESNLEEFQRITHIIENILFLARTENPQFNLQKEFLNLKEEITVVCEYYQAIAEEKSIEITCQGEAVLFANQVMLRRLMSNILSNALKYTPMQGQVHFAIKQLDSGVVEITLQDNGIGIPAEHTAKVFNRFYRVDVARSQHPGSIGLGLAIVKSIVSLHQGSVTISSKVGQGTLVTISFPK